MSLQGAEVDILLATHNGEGHLREQIESIRRQTHPRWRLLISDDASTDGTRDLIDEYVSLDDRVHLVSTERRGSPAANFLFLLGRSTAEYFLLCDQDDIWVDTKIERLLSVAQRKGSTGCHAVASDAYVLGREGIVSGSFLDYSGLKRAATGPRRVLIQNPVLGCTLLGTRGLREKVNETPPDPSTIIMHDWWIALVASIFGSLEVVSDRLIYYRQHDTSQVGAVEYTATNLLRASRRGKAKTKSIVEQARHLHDLYGGDPGTSRLEDVRELLHAFEAASLVRPILLAKGRYLKNGALRACGQLYFSMHYDRGRD